MADVVSGFQSGFGLGRALRKDAEEAADKARLDNTKNLAASLHSGVLVPILDPSGAKIGANINPSFTDHLDQNTPELQRIFQNPLVRQEFAAGAGDPNVKDVKFESLQKLDNGTYQPRMSLLDEDGNVIKQNVAFPASSPNQFIERAVSIVRANDPHLGAALYTELENASANHAADAALEAMRNGQDEHAVLGQLPPQFRTAVYKAMVDRHKAMAELRPKTELLSNGIRVTTTPDGEQKFGGVDEGFQNATRQAHAQGLYDAAQVQNETANAYQGDANRRALRTQAAMEAGRQDLADAFQDRSLGRQRKVELFDAETGNLKTGVTARYQEGLRQILKTGTPAEKAYAAAQLSAAGRSAKEEAADTAGTGDMGQGYQTNQDAVSASLAATETTKKVDAMARQIPPGSPRALQFFAENGGLMSDDERTTYMATHHINAKGGASGGYGPGQVGKALGSTLNRVMSETPDDQRSQSHHGTVGTFYSDLTGSSGLKPSEVGLDGVPYDKKVADPAFKDQIATVSSWDRSLGTDHRNSLDALNRAYEIMRNEGDPITKDGAKEFLDLQPKAMQWIQNKGVTLPFSKKEGTDWAMQYVYGLKKAGLKEDDAIAAATYLLAAKTLPKNAPAYQQKYADALKNSIYAAAGTEEPDVRQEAEATAALWKKDHETSLRNIQPGSMHRGNSTVPRLFFEGLLPEPAKKGLGAAK